MLISVTGIDLSVLFYYAIVIKPYLCLKRKSPQIYDLCRAIYVVGRLLIVIFVNNIASKVRNSINCPGRFGENEASENHNAPSIFRRWKNIEYINT